MAVLGDPSVGELVARVAELEAERELTLRLAQTDSLTGLVNRGAFTAELCARLDAARERGERVALYVIDLDRFKHLNDTLGHHAGDLLLREVAVRLQANIGREDIVARLGGDEFALLVRSCSTQAALRRLAGSLIQALDQPFHLSGTDSFVGVSVGIIAKGRTASRSELMRRADLAMYQAKRHGSGGFRFFKPQMEEAAQRRSVFERDLRAALAARDQLFVEFQPRVAAGTQQVVGFEADTDVDRKDYGLTWNVALETGGFLVGDNIKINLEVEAVQQAAAEAEAA